MQFYWTPPPEPRAGDPAPGVPARLRRFLTLSTAAHVAGAALATWLSLSLVAPRPDEALLVRTIDFVEPAPARPPAGGGSPRERAGGGPAVRAPRAAARAAPTPRPSPPPAASTPAPSAPPAPAHDTEAGDMPTPTPEEARLAAATPKAVAGAARGPAPVVAPPRQATPPPSAAPAAVAGIDGGEGPRAMVALPPALVHGGGAGGAGTGSGGAAGAGTGVATGPGTSGGAGGTGIDPGDPDFSEYFRLIERRVRAAWRFPEGLGGTTQTVKIGFALAPEGSLRDARVVSSSSATLNESALSAMKRAAPFPPLPHKFRALAGQPLVMSFTVIIR